jgi:tetratricopeptide (TPR) repeat protein
MSGEPTLTEIDALADSGEVAAAISSLSRLAAAHRSSDDASSRRLVLAATFKRGLLLVEQDNFEAAERALSDGWHLLEDAKSSSAACLSYLDGIAGAYLARARKARQNQDDATAVAAVTVLERLTCHKAPAQWEPLVLSGLIKASATAGLGHPLDGARGLELLIARTARPGNARIRELLYEAECLRLELLADGGELAVACDGYATLTGTSLDPGIDPSLAVAACAGAARVNFAAGRPDEGARYFERIAETMPARSCGALGALATRVLCRLAEELRAAGQIERATRTWDWILALAADSGLFSAAPLRLRASVERGELLLLAGRYAEAARLVETVDLQKNRSNQLGRLSARALGTIGIALASDGRFEEAIETFDAILAHCESQDDRNLEPFAGLAAINKALALEALGRDAEASTTRQVATESWPEAVLAALDNNIITFAESDVPEAQTQLHAALYSKASVLSDLGARDEALETLERLLGSLKNAVTHSSGDFTEAAVALRASLTA